MDNRVNSNITIENARIGFRNFSGKEGKYNVAGKRNFCVFLEHDLAVRLQEDGWNVKYLRPREDDEEPQAYLQVSVAFENVPPKIVLISSNGKSTIDEDEVNILDWAEFKNIDLIIRPYNWEVNGKSGVKAYLKTMYATIEIDEFESKYADVPDSAKNSFQEDAYGD